MKRNYFNILIIFLTFFSGIILSAREFKIISLDNFGQIEQLQFRDTSDNQRIIIRKYTPNRSFPVPDNNVIHFYGINPDTGACSRRALLRISFENQKGDSIVVLQSDNDEPETINYQILEDNPDSFPILSTLILNLSDKRIISKIGSEMINLSPNSRKLVTLPKNERGSFSEKVIFAALKENQSINYFYSSFWRVPFGRKTICIIDYIEDSDSHKLTEILL